jgi:hypothetical protein
MNIAPIVSSKSRAAGDFTWKPRVSKRVAETFGVRMRRLSARQTVAKVSYRPSLYQVDLTHIIIGEGNRCYSQRAYRIPRNRSSASFSAWVIAHLKNGGVMTDARIAGRI